MTILERAVSQLHLRWILRFLAAAVVCSGSLFSQSPASTGPISPVAAAAPAVHAVVQLDGTWRFQIGDDPRWADTNFDDSNWLNVSLSHPITEQGVAPYFGYGWYRLHLTAAQLADFTRLSGNEPLQLLVTSTTVGQTAVFINGALIAQTRGMASGTMFRSPPLTVPLNGPLAAGPLVIAIRAWAGPEVAIHRGIVDRVEVGSATDIAKRYAIAQTQRWDEYAIASLVIVLLFLGVALIGGALYAAQRHHPEYLWLAILCTSVASTGVADATFAVGLIPLTAYQIVTVFTGRIFMAVTLEFVSRFSVGKPQRWVRIVQIAVLVLPFLSFLPFHQLYDFLSVSAEIVFLVVVCSLLFRAWRNGRGDAGIMLLPFFLGASADSLDTVLGYLASLHWIPDQYASLRLHIGPVGMSVGTVSFTVFVASILAVILYRFIRVSQVEQRSSAEIAAAKSVQALLIPTHLPSNRHFMLESAYLPVHGVGGDFFQVLPLKDDSLLVVVGDVSGKGLQAAMNSSTIVGALRNELSNDPATILEHLNRVLIGAVHAPGAVPEIDAAPCYATCLCARVYPDGKLVIANAGHLGPYRDGRELEVFPGLPLGVIAPMQYEQCTYHLNAGDRLVFLSDGVVEATNEEGELFGFERTQQVSNEPARYIAQTAQRFGQTDDITVVSLYFVSRTPQRDAEALLHPA